MNPVYITRAAAALPNAPVGNEDMERVLGRVGGRPSRARALVLRSNGIRQRYYAIDPLTGATTHSNAQLAAAAVRGLVDAGFALAQLELLSCGTSSPDQFAPNHAVMVHGELGPHGAPACEVVSTAGVCVSGMTALKYGWLAVGSGASSNAVVTGSETASSFMRACNFEAENEARIAALEKRPALAFEKDFLRWMLSDGAGAFLLEPQPRKGALALRIDWIDQRSYAHQHEPCMYAGAEKRADGTLAGWRDSGAPQDWLARSTLSWKQDVRQLEDGIRAATTQAFAAVLAKRALRAQDFDWFVPHFSSEFFRPVMDDLLPAALRIPQERWFTNLQEKGNTGSAAIFLMLEELLNEGHLRAGQRLLCYVPESARFTIALAGLTVVAG